MKNTRHRKSSKRSSTRKHRGGASYPPSAWGFQMGNLGDGWTQFTNALTLKAGDNVGSVQSNEIVPIKNLTAEDAQPMLKPNMSGGMRKKRHSRRVRKNKSMKGGKNTPILDVGAAAVVSHHGGARKRKSMKSMKGGKNTPILDVGAAAVVTHHGGARKRKSMKKRGGGSRLLGAVAKQALVPFTLLASQMKYKKHRKTN
jgi:hypothetical protein